MINIEKEKPAKRETLTLFSVTVKIGSNAKGGTQLNTSVEGHKAEMTAFLKALDVNPEESRGLTRHAAKALVRDFVQQVVNLSESIEGAEMEETED